MKNNNKKKESAALSFLYKTVPGRVLLKAATARWVSIAAGKFLDSRLSKGLIKGFVKKNGNMMKCFWYNASFLRYVIIM